MRSRLLLLHYLLLLLVLLLLLLLLLQVSTLHSRRLSRLDALLKSFQYTAAMDVALTTS